MRIKIIVILVLVTNAWAQVTITETERTLLGPHVQMIKSTMPVLEQNVQENVRKYLNLMAERDDLKSKVASAGYVKKSQIMLRIKYLEQNMKIYQKKVTKERSQLIVYYCLLDAWHLRQMSQDEVRQARAHLHLIKNRWEKAEKARRKSEKRRVSAERRLKQIPIEREQLKKDLANLEKRLAILEYKKSWGNWASRNKLKSEIAVNKSTDLKLKAEAKLQQKNVEDAREEENSMALEKAEVEIAMRLLE